MVVRKTKTQRTKTGKQEILDELRAMVKNQKMPKAQRLRAAVLWFEYEGK